MNLSPELRRQMLDLQTKIKPFLLGPDAAAVIWGLADLLYFVAMLERTRSIRSAVANLLRELAQKIEEDLNG